MREDEEMRLSTKIYPPVPEFGGIRHDIKYNSKPNILYPEASYYKGQLQHSDHGVIDNAGLEFSNFATERILNIDWIKRVAEQTKIPLKEVLERFFTSDYMRIVLTGNDEIEKHESLLNGLDYYLNHVRYGTGENLLCYITQRDIDNLHSELFFAIVAILEEYKESKA